jgi:nucleoredoxin
LCKQLCEIYPKLKQQHADAFEIIFCSYDRSEESFREHFSTMPWLSFPYGNQKALSKAYDIHGL